MADYYEINGTVFVDGETVVNAAWLNRVKAVLTHQLNAVARAQAGKVYAAPDATSMAIAAGVGLNVTIQPGVAAAIHSTLGGVVMVNTSEYILAVPASSTVYVFAQVETATNKTIETAVPKFVTDALPTLANAVPLAQVTTSGSTVTGVVDLRDLGVVNLPDVTAPSTTTNKLYSVATGVLMWAGKRLATVASTLGASQVVETDGSGNLITAAKGTAYNKNFGTATNTVTQGNDSRLNLDVPLIVTGNATFGTANGTYFANATSGNITLTLPAATGATHAYRVKKTDASANTVTVQRAGADTVDGATSKVLSTQYESYIFASDGASMWGVF